MRKYSFKNENMATLVEQAKAEQLTLIMQHPYYGLSDGNGWLTRYPMDMCVWSRGQVKSYLSGGASFDSCAAWGCDPMREVPKHWEGKIYILSRLIKAYGRYDFLPVYPGEDAFPLHESIDLTSYLKLIRGYEIKSYLKDQWGVETSCSLFTLAKKNSSWIWRKIQRECVLDSVIRKLRSERRRNYYEFLYCMNEDLEYAMKILSPENDNAAFAYARKCVSKSVTRQELKELTYLSTDHKIRINSHRLAWINLKRIHANRDMDDVHHNKFLNTTYYPNLNNMWSSEGKLWYSGKIVFNKINSFDDYDMYRPRSIDNMYAIKIRRTFFVWLKDKDFNTHIESRLSLKDAVEKVRLSHASLVEKQNILESGVITLRQFRYMTQSCYSGTKRFLNNNMPHIARLMKDYDGWDSLLVSDLANVKWHLTPEAMNSIRFRF